MPRKKKIAKKKTTSFQPDHQSRVEVEIEEDTDPRLTLDEAIEWFKKNPHEEDFISLDKPGSAIAHGNHYIKFKDGEYKTSDPVEVEIIMRSGLAFVPLNPILRNLKK